MFCCNAAGDLLPPMTVYKVKSGNFYDTWMEGAPDDYVFTANPSGWFGMREYEYFVIKVLIRWIKRRIPKEEVKVLIADNLGAHISPYVMQLCREHNIRYIFLPPNSTHLTQPLDVGVFGPMKKHWRAQLDRFKESQVAKGVRGGTIKKEMFPSLLAAMLSSEGSVNNPANIRSGFAACGIYPLNQERVLARLPPEQTQRAVQTEFDQAGVYMFLSSRGGGLGT